MAQTDHAHANIWVTTDGSGSWDVRREGEDAPLSTHTTQAEAFEAGRTVAKSDGVELIVQGEDGQIVERNTYTGHDPSDIPG